VTKITCLKQEHFLGIDCMNESGWVRGDFDVSLIIYTNDLKAEKQLEMHLTQSFSPVRLSAIPETAWLLVLYREPRVIANTKTE